MVLSAVAATAAAAAAVARLRLSLSAVQCGCRSAATAVALTMQMSPSLPNVVTPEDGTVTVPWHAHEGALHAFWASLAVVDDIIILLAAPELLE